MKALRLPKAIFERAEFGLLEAVLGNTGDGYPAAACRGRHELFDAIADTPTTPRRAEAADLCARCPQRDGCGWAVT